MHLPPAQAYPVRASLGFEIVSVSKAQLFIRLRKYIKEHLLRGNEG